MSYKYKGQLSTLADMYLNTGDHEPLLEIERVYAQAAKAEEYEANLNEVKRQLKIKIRHARRDGDYSEAFAFSEALDMI